LPAKKQRSLSSASLFLSNQVEHLIFEFAGDAYMILSLLRKLSIRHRIVLMMLIGIAGMTVMVFISIVHANQQYIQLEKQNTKNLVETAKNLVKHFHRRAQNGELSTPAAKMAAANALKALSLTERSYVYIYHELNFMIMHPMLPDQSLPAYTPEDIVTSIAIDEAQMEQHRVLYGLDQQRSTPMEILFKYHPETRSGFFEYIYFFDTNGLGLIAEVDDPYIPHGSLSKMGYGSYFSPWQWSILGGVYLGDLESAINQSLVDILPLLLLVAGVFCGLSWTISKSISNPISAGIDRIGEILDRHQFSLPEYNKGDEMHQLDDAFTTLIEQLDKRDEDLRGKSTLLFESNQRLTEHQSKLEKTVEERTQDFKLAKEQAENATEAKSQFLSTMTHELRTPMSGVIGIVDLLKETTLDFTQREYVDIIGASGTQLLDIVGDILNFEKLSANKLELESIEFNFHKLCDELVMPFKLRKKGKSDLEFIVTYSDDCPKNLMGDSIRIKQVINNFLSNAFKFTDAGSITLEVTSIRKNDRPYVLVSVTDTGIGLNSDQQRVLFEEYQQASSSTARKYGGTGLGLAISRKMVALMGGAIGLTSVQNKGSTFNFNFPLMEARAMSSELDGKAANFPPALSLVNLQVLVAEDNLVNQMVIKGYLKRLGIDPVLAENGEEALKRIGEHSFDIILMDINMPVMDGVETTRKIREGEKQKNTIGMPIYGLTATTLESAQQDFIAAGMNGVLSKPIDLHQLIRTLEASVS